MLTRPAKYSSLVYLFTFAATAIVAFGGLCFLPDEPYIRYQSLKGTIFERAAWNYERIHFDSTPIDVVILGNSRSGAAINSPLLEDLLSRQGEGRVRTVNFSIPASGFDVQYSLAKQLFQEKSPRILLISLSDQLPRDGHQAFADIADPIDVIRAPLLINRLYAKNLVYLPMRQLRGMYSWAFSDACGYTRTWNPQTYLGPNLDTRAAATGTVGALPSKADEAELERESKIRKAQITKPLLPASLHSIEFGLSEYYINKIVELAAAKNTKVFFLYLPFYQGFEQPLDHEWLSKRGEILEARFLKSDFKNYSDCAHTTEAGSLLVTEWLAEKLGQHLLAPAGK